MGKKIEKKCKKKIRWGISRGAYKLARTSRLKKHTKKCTSGEKKGKCKTKKWVLEISHGASKLTVIKIKGHPSEWII